MVVANSKKSLQFLPLRSLILRGLAVFAVGFAGQPEAIAQTMPDAVPQAANSALLAGSSAAFPEAYTLGAGDLIQIDIFNIPEFSGPENGAHEVLIDGTLSLPFVGSVDVQGLTLEQAQRQLTAVYSRLLTQPPQLTVTLMSPRPVRVAIAGEVNRPGTYATEIASEDTSRKWPTLTQVIQEAGGITQQANVKAVEVRRPQRGGPDAVLTVSLWELIRTGNLSQDASLRDGDTIVIPTADSPSPEEQVRISSANFSPEQIPVQVVGEVPQPGTVNLPANATLNQAVLAAGGFKGGRARTSSVELVRLNPDGSVDRRVIAVDLSVAANSDNNPILRPNDVIIVDRSAIATAGDALGTFLNPITAITAIFRIFGGF